MKPQRFAGIGALLLVLAFADLAPADVPFIVNHQGRLTNADGQPVNGPVTMTFAIWDDSTSGQELWIETQTVEVSDGLFSVRLGGGMPLDPSIFGAAQGPLWLQTQVESDLPLAPRQRLGSMPFAFIAQGVNGDIQTAPGWLMISGGDPANAATTLANDSAAQSSLQASAGVFSSNKFDNATAQAANSLWRHTPAVGDCTMVNIKTDNNLALSLFGATQGSNSSNKVDNASSASASSIWSHKPAVNDCTQVDIITDNGSAVAKWNATSGGSSSHKIDEATDISAASTWLHMTAPDDCTQVKIITNDIREGKLLINRPGVQRISIGGTGTGGQIVVNDPTQPNVSINADDSGASLVMSNPGPPTVSLLTLTGTSTGASLVMAQPGPPDVPLLTLTGTSTGASLVMVNPGPPDSPVLSLTNDASGANIVMSEPGPPNVPLLTLTGTSTGASLVMKQPGPISYPVKLNSDGATGMMGIFQTDASGLEVPAVQMTTNIDGSSLVMNNPGPPNSPIVQLNANADGSGVIAIERVNPDVPPSPCITLSNDGVGSSLVMQNPGPIQSPTLQMNVSADGGAISFADPSGSTMMNLNSGGGGYFMGNLGFGTSGAPNILTVVQRSSTQPIADSWTTYSSRRLKKNIRTLDGALEKVKRLRGVSFDWKADGKHDIGLVAEEVGQVMPEVVAYEDNGIDAKSVDYARLVSVLIEAVKEQQRSIDELKSELGELKAQNERQASINAER